MDLYSHRRIHVLPGFRVNFGARGASVSFGHRGVWYTPGRRGRHHATLGWPGAPNHGAVGRPQRPVWRLSAEIAEDYRQEVARRRRLRRAPSALLTLAWLCGAAALIALMIHGRTPFN